MRPSLVVSLDTNNAEVAAVQQPFWSTSIQASCGRLHSHGKSTWEVQVLRVQLRYSSAIIGRWCLPWNLLSEQLHLKNEASRAQSSCGRAKRHSVDGSYSHHGFSLLPRMFKWPSCYDIYLLTLLNWFLRDLEALDQDSIEPLLCSEFYTEPFSLLNHVEIS